MAEPPLDPSLPIAEQLIRKMELDQTYKDVTFETLNRRFLPLSERHFPM